MLGGSLVSHTRVGVAPHHVIDRLHYRQHLLRRSRYIQESVPPLRALSLDIQSDTRSFPHRVVCLVVKCFSLVKLIYKTKL